MKKNLIPVLALGLIALLGSCTTTPEASSSAAVTSSAAATSSSAAASSTATVANKDKPLIWFNRQPSDPTTGVIDTAAMTFNPKTYYVGFDSAGGGAVQGKMITDYLATKTKAELDKNNDGILGYVLCIGDLGHNDSKARTKGIRQALGTWLGTAANPYDAGAVVEGSVTVKDGTLKVDEIAAKEMKNSSGATWDASTATDTVPGWVTQYGNKIDLFVSNNDGMAMGCLAASAYPAGTPIFGYDANQDAIASIQSGTGETGTVSQNVDAQAAGVLMMLRNLIDGATGADVYTKGFTTVDQYGNKITPTMAYDTTNRAILAANSAVTAANASGFYDAKGVAVRDPAIKQTTAPLKKVLLTLYNSSDNFLSSSYKPALQYYAPLMDISLSVIEGDGTSEASVTDKLANLSSFDAYAFNMVKTNSGSDYTSKLAS
jgi:methyl-galactoside transport system substrate-binding protein